MDFEEVSVDQILGSREEDLEVSVGNDSSREKAFLVEDMADRLTFPTPLVEGIADAISRSGVGRAGGRRS